MSQALFQFNSAINRSDSLICSNIRRNGEKELLQERSLIGQIMCLML